MQVSLRFITTRYLSRLFTFERLKGGFLPTTDFFVNKICFWRKFLEGISLRFLDPPVWSFLRRLLSRVLGVPLVVLAHVRYICHPTTGPRSHPRWRRATRDPRPFLPDLKCLPFLQSPIRQRLIKSLFYICVLKSHFSRYSSLTLEFVYNNVVPKAEQVLMAK